MLSMLAMYLLVKCTAIQTFFSIICGIAFGIFSIAFLGKWISIDNYGDKYNVTLEQVKKYEEKMTERFKKFIWPFFSAGVIFLLLAMAMPDTKQMAIIYVTPKVVNSVMANEQIKKLPSNLVGLANAWIEEFKPDTNSVKTDGTKAEKKVEKKSEAKSIPDSTKEKIADKVLDRVIKEVTK